MKLRNIITAMILLACSQSATAQDPFYSQAHRSPLSLNPALAGDGQQSAWRVQSNLRSQWWGGGTQPYKTGSLSLEHRIALGDEGNALALSGGFQSEVSNGGILKNNFASFGAAYHNRLDGLGRHSVSVGLLGTYANRLLDPSGATTQTQFGSFGFMRGSVAYDPVMVVKHRYWDVQAGLGYSYRGEQWSGHLGGAVFHAARPEEGAYMTGGYRLARRNVAEGSLGYLNGQGGKWTLRANAQWQGQHRVQQLAVDYRLPIGEDAGQALSFGLGKRLGDAFFPYVQLEWQGLAIGMSYDAVDGAVHRYYNRVNSAELTLAYSFGKKK